MRTINITFTVSERQYEYLRLAKCEQPNPQRMKMQLLSQAMSTLRREGEMVMNEARDQAHGPARLHPDAKAAKPGYAEARYAEALIKEGKQRARDVRKAKSMPTKRKSSDDWMDDDNMKKLRATEPKIN